MRQARESFALFSAFRLSLATALTLLASSAAALETVNMALSNKNFQMILYPIAQERGYMQEEGIDLRVILARAELSVQATMAGSFQFNMGHHGRGKRHERRRAIQSDPRHQRQSALVDSVANQRLRASKSSKARRSPPAESLT